ncbi:DNA primase [Candidatus Nomurabacteria bacterium]|nr:DNA primase [Candidatus Nomurabacteria bacterium]
MSSSTVEEIKERLGIVELVGSYIKLQKAGSNYRGLCPFHNEKSPSFFVSADRNSFYCFGCGAKGDIFSFVQQFESLDFLGALKMLAEKAGVEIKYDQSPDKEEKNKLYEMLEKTTTFFQKNIENSKESLDYLKSRGLTEQTIDDWRIGLVQDGWRNILDFLKSKGYKESEIESAGLIKKGERGDYYDRFRNRIMFPIFDPANRVIGYSGRTLSHDPKEAKYLNSPETILFNKSHILFGYHSAKNSIRKNNFSILVEGQFDVILSQQSGYQNTVAVSGTALTDFQIDLLKRLSDRMVIALDGDGAGFRASEKAWKIALSKGMDVKVGKMEVGDDPASIIQSDPNKWKEVIKKSLHIIDFLIDKVKTENKDPRITLKEIHQKIIPYIVSIPSSLEQSHFVERLSSEFKIDKEVIWNEISTYNAEETVFENKNYAVVDKAKSSNSIGKHLVNILFWQKNKLSPDIDVGDLEKQIAEIIGLENTKDFEQSKISEEDIFFLESQYDDKELLEKEIKEMVGNFRKKFLEKERDRLKTQLREAEQKKDEKRQQDILKEINDLSKSLEASDNLK